MGDAKVIRDPIHGAIVIYPEEMEILESTWFQRLRHIKQLSLVNHVYPGAEHTRFAHSLGTMDLAGRATAAICDDPAAEIDQGKRMHLVRLARLAALLHDIGHPPFSHAGEAAFTPGLRHEDVGRNVVTEVLAGVIDQEFAKFEITADLLRRLLSSVVAPDYFFVKELLSGPADVDKMDYLLRDAHYCGVGYGRFDLTRLIEKLSARVRIIDGQPRKVLVFQHGALHAIEEFVLARYWMYNGVYYHSVVRQLEILLGRALTDVLAPYGGSWPTDLNEFLDWNDNRALTELAANARSDAPSPSVVRLLSRRKFFERVIEVPLAKDLAARVMFADLVRSLEREFGAAVVKDEPTIGFKLYADEEGGERAGLQIEDASGGFVSVEKLSLILRTIPEWAIPYRIFVDPAIAAAAHERVKAHVLSDYIAKGMN